MVPLIPEKPRRTPERVTVLEGNDPLRIASVKNLLEESGIPSCIWQEESGESGGRVSPAIDQPCRLEVPLDCEDEARALLQSMEASDLDDDVQEGQEAKPEPDPDLELVTVLEGNNPLMIATAKSVLKKAGIPFYVCGEEFGLRLLPYGSFPQPWYRIQVAAERQAHARELLQPIECGDSLA